MTTLNHYGHHPEHQLFLAGDCIITYSGNFIFPEENMSHYTINDQEFYLDERLTNYVAPVFFPGIDHPTAMDLPEDWQQERETVAAILHTLLRDLHNLIGHGSAEALIATTLAFLMHPHLLNSGIACGKPGLWIHGPKGSGKSNIAQLLMRLCGMHNHFPLTGDATPLAYERIFATYSGIPVHIDEWRNSHLKANRIHQSKIEGLLSSAYTGLAIAKGTADASNSIQLAKAITVPIITGEQVTNDSALLSRYILVTASPRQIPMGDHMDSIHSILSRSSEYYRITRFLLRVTGQFSAMTTHRISSYLQASASISSDGRMRENQAIIHSAFSAALNLITAPDPNNGEHYLQSLETWFTNQH